MQNYTKTIWKVGEAPAINATNLNKIETGISNAQTTANSNEAKIATLSTGESPRGQLNPTGNNYGTAVIGYSYYIGGLTSSYTYTSGDLNGTTVNNLDKIIYTSSGWKWINSNLDNVSVLTGYKNYIINGGMNVWQRGNTFTTQNGLTADMWGSIGSGGTSSITRENFTDSSGAKNYYLKYVFTSGAYHILRQYIENVTTLKGSFVTLSFIARSSDVAPLRLVLRQNFGSGGSDTIDTLIASDISVTDSWVKYSYSFAVPDFYGKTIGDGSFIGIRFDFQDGAGRFDLKNVQLEKGEIATNFEQVPYGLELSLCQRYLPYRSKTGQSGKVHGFGYGFTTTQAIITIPIQTNMRTVNPSNINYSGNFILIGSGAIIPVTSMSLTSTSGDSNSVTILANVSSGVVVNEAYILKNNVDASAYIEILAEI